MTDKTMGVADWIKIEELKGLVVQHLRAVGLLGPKQELAEKDLDLIMTAMAQLQHHLLLKETKDEKFDYLVSYIIGLWGRLIVDFEAKIEDL